MKKEMKMKKQEEARSGSNELWVKRGEEERSDASRPAPTACQTVRRSTFQPGPETAHSQQTTNTYFRKTTRGTPMSV